MASTTTTPLTGWVERSFDSTHAITKLSIELGAVYIFARTDLDKLTSSTTTITIRSDNPTLLDALAVSESRGSELTLGWKTGLGRLIGQYVVEVVVPPRSIEAVSFSASGIGAVHANVLASSSSSQLHLANLGSGRLLVQEDTLEASGLSLRQTGSGFLQLTSPSAAIAGALQLQNMGSGTVAIVAAALSASYASLASSGSGSTLAVVKSSLRVADGIEMTNQGSGHVALHADVLTTQRLSQSTLGSGAVDAVTTTHFFAAALSMAVTGSGRIKCIGPGAANTLKVNITGSGHAYTNVTAAMPAASKVAIVGSGSAHLSSMAVADVNLIGKGKVVKFETAPATPEYLLSLLPVPTPQAVDFVPIGGITNLLTKALFR
ncbi:Aste57867_2953 [Aphanomyces stellatus]|uniref:Aste57867_2953 protein n=1 Tax=Aphanomyces stellatus TaxID=120398 RepID=A0A485KCZ2_9STRA|nr:hypothetical protein As57867_002944 [Aphanomyces stellatus]VFT80136.1 Aste57867_2953 [Aphanomyces stellatus]